MQAHLVRNEQDYEYLLDLKEEDFQAILHMRAAKLDSCSALNRPESMFHIHGQLDGGSVRTGAGSHATRACHAHAAHDAAMSAGPSESCAAATPVQANGQAEVFYMDNTDTNMSDTDTETGTDTSVRFFTEHNLHVCM